LVNDTMKYYSFTTNAKKHTIVASTYADTTHKFSLTYELIKPVGGIPKDAKDKHSKTDTSTYLVLKGMWKKDSVYIKMRQLDPNNFRLLKRGFHWVNEFPYNR